jgi:hypothetical protein
MVIVNAGVELGDRSADAAIVPLIDDGSGRRGRAHRRGRTAG